MSNLNEDQVSHLSLTKIGFSMRSAHLVGVLNVPMRRAQCPGTSLRKLLIFSEISHRPRKKPLLEPPNYEKEGFKNTLIRIYFFLE